MYKILSLDGGGSWAILQLLTLKERYKDQFPELKGHDILKEYDLVIANSGGSIVLAALVENWAIDKAIKLFSEKEKRERIFSKNSYKESYWPVSLSKLFSFGPKYSVKRKGRAFQSIFKNAEKMNMDKLPEWIGKKDLKIVVCAYDALNNRAKFFKSYASKGQQGEFVRLTRAIHASSNAPIQYFDFPARFKASSGIWYECWDGALGGFNNPVVAGVIEAFRLGIEPHDISLVSLGTGNKLMSTEDKEEFYDLRDRTTLDRFKKWKLSSYKYQFRYFMKTVMNQAKTILYEPPDWANFVAYMFLKKNKEDDDINFIRLSPMIHIDKNTPVEVKPLLRKLYKLDMDLTSDKDIKLLFQCFHSWKTGAIKNQPIQYNVTRENELEYLVGEESFEEGINKWE